jgi:hypothetical protein
MRFDISMNYVIFMTVAESFQYLPHVVAGRNKYKKIIRKSDRQLLWHADEKPSKMNYFNLVNNNDVDAVKR